MIDNLPEPNNRAMLDSFLMFFAEPEVTGVGDILTFFLYKGLFSFLLTSARRTQLRFEGVNCRSQRELRKGAGYSVTDKRKITTAEGGEKKCREGRREKKNVVFLCVTACDIAKPTLGYRDTPPGAKKN